MMIDDEDKDKDEDDDTTIGTNLQICDQNLMKCF